MIAFPNLSGFFWLSCLDLFYKTKQYLALIKWMFWEVLDTQVARDFTAFCNLSDKLYLVILELAGMFQ